MLSLQVNAILKINSAIDNNSKIKLIPLEDLFYCLREKSMLSTVQEFFCYKIISNTEIVLWQCLLEPFKKATGTISCHWWQLFNSYLLHGSLNSIDLLTQKCCFNLHWEWVWWIIDIKGCKACLKIESINLEEIA